MKFKAKIKATNLKVAIAVSPEHQKVIAN